MIIMFSLILVITKFELEMKINHIPYGRKT